MSECHICGREVSPAGGGRFPACECAEQMKRDEQTIIRLTRLKDVALNDKDHLCKMILECWPERQQHTWAKRLQTPF